MALQHFQRIFNGANLTALSNGIALIRAPFAGKIKKIQVWTGVDLDASPPDTGNALFNVRKNNALQFTGSEITISSSSNYGEKTALNIAVLEGDKIYLDLTGKTQTDAVAAPIVFQVTFDDEAAVGLTRTNQTFSTSSIAAAVSENLDVAVGKESEVFIIETNVPARVRAYSTSALRTTDSARAIGTEGEEVILFEVVTTAGNLKAIAKDSALCFNADTPASNLIYFRVENRHSAASVVTTTITKLVLEA